MAGISQVLYGQIRAQLLDCEALYNVDQLRALFSVEELRPFRSRLKIAVSGDAQADLLISDLLDSRRATGENALVLFLQILGRNYDPNDARHTQLLTLAEQLQTALTGNNSSASTSQSSVGERGTVYHININQAQGLAIGDGAKAISSSAAASQSEQETPLDEERTHLQTLLAQYRRNLQQLEIQKAYYGAGEVPLHLLNQLDEVRKTIQELQQKLHE